MIEEIATYLYNASCDLDHEDYEENKENELALLTSAIDKIKSYGCWNDDFMALYKALELITENNM